MKVIPKSSGNILIEWDASPNLDIIADSIALIIMNVKHNPSASML